jgi:hypothetical protein
VLIDGRAIPQAVSHLLPTAASPWFETGSGHVVFVVDRVALKQISFEHFSFFCQSSIIIHHPVKYSMWK